MEVGTWSATRLLPRSIGMRGQGGQRRTLMEQFIFGIQPRATTNIGMAQREILQVD